MGASSSKEELLPPPVGSSKDELPTPSIVSLSPLNDPLKFLYERSFEIVQSVRRSMGALLIKDKLPSPPDGSIKDEVTPPPVHSLPPLNDPPLLVYQRRSQVQSSYDNLFAKVACNALFSDYYINKEYFIDKDCDRIQAHLTWRSDSDPDLDPDSDPDLDHIYKLVFNSKGAMNSLDAILHWQRDFMNLHTFAQIDFRLTENQLGFTSSVFSPYYGVGSFLKFTLLKPEISERVFIWDENSVVGFRYESPKLSVGSAFNTFYKGPSSAWIVGRLGKFSAVCQYKLQEQGAIGVWNKHLVHPFRYPKNWSFAVDYCGGKRGIYEGKRDDPSGCYNFSAEIQELSKFIASCYIHMVVQRKIRNPFEQKEVVATNHIEFGFEFHKSLFENVKDPPKVQVGASWQRNENFMVKGKLGIANFAKGNLGITNSAIVFLVRSWWDPAQVLSFSAITDNVLSTPKYGIGLRFKPPDVNPRAEYVRYTPEYLLDGAYQKALSI